MYVIALLKCLRQGHVWRVSHNRPGFMTCARCHARKPVDLAA